LNLDYYKILGVTKKSSSEEIKKAYKKLAIKYHPDKNDGEELSTEIFKSVKEAYETLSDNHKKTIYDNKQSYSRPITKSQQSYQSSTNRKNNTYQPKPKYESDLKYKLYALAVLAIFTLLIMAIYPFINKWASNDKLKSAEKMMKIENWDEAYYFATEAITQWDENGKAYLIRAKINSGVYKKYSSALSDFNQAFIFSPSDSISATDYYMRAKCNHEVGKIDNACKDLHISLKKGFDRAKIDIEAICN